MKVASSQDFRKSIASSVSRLAGESLSFGHPRIALGP